MKSLASVRLVRTIPAPRQAVFDAWLDPVRIARFMKPAPGISVPDPRVDARVGGKFQVDMQIGDTRVPHGGEYKEIRRYDRLVFTWVSPHTPADTYVALTFEELGPRSTRVTLEHFGLGTGEARESHEAGWGSILEWLGKELAA